MAKNDRGVLTGRAAPTIDIGIGDRDRTRIADGLSRVLADTYSLYLKTHNFHWNVEGPMFNTLHLMFMEQYTELWNALDAIAERIRALGYPAPGTNSEFARLTSIEDRRRPGGDGHGAAARVSGHEAVARTARKTFPVVDKAGDESTADLLTQRLQVHEKTAWMLRRPAEVVCGVAGIAYGIPAGTAPLRIAGTTGGCPVSLRIELRFGVSRKATRTRPRQPHCWRDSWNCGALRIDSLKLTLSAKRRISMSLRAATAAESVDDRGIGLAGLHRVDGRRNRHRLAVCGNGRRGAVDDLLRKCRLAIGCRSPPQEARSCARSRDLLFAVVRTKRTPGRARSLTRWMPERIALCRNHDHLVGREHDGTKWLGVPATGPVPPIGLCIRSSSMTAGEEGAKTSTLSPLRMRSASSRETPGVEHDVRAAAVSLRTPASTRASGRRGSRQERPARRRRLRLL